MRRRGYSLLEVVVALAVFGIFLFIVTIVTTEMRRVEKKWPVNFMKHPQVTAVLSRLRKDVLDATVPYYPSSIGTYQQTAKTLLLTTLEERGTTRDVVWDFSVKGEVRRKVYVADQKISEWVARGIQPDFRILLVEMPNRPYGLRVQATDKDGRLAIDQILQPRATLMASDDDEESTPSPSPPLPPLPPLPTDTSATTAPPTDSAPGEEVPADGAPPTTTSD